MEGWVTRLAGGGDNTDDPPEPGGSSAQVLKDSRVKRQMSSCGWSGNGASGLVRSVSDTKMSSMTGNHRALASPPGPQGAVAARYKAQNRIHGIHKIVEYRTDYKLPYLERYV